jgi:hypothetical protein
MSGEQASANQGGFGQAKGYQNYQSQVDPEELFRTIFGDAFKSGRGFESIFENFGADNTREERFEATQVCQTSKKLLKIKQISNFFSESWNFHLKKHAVV